MWIKIAKIFHHLQRSDISNLQLECWIRNEGVCRMRRFISEKALRGYSVEMTVVQSERATYWNENNEWELRTDSGNEKWDNKKSFWVNRSWNCHWQNGEERSRNGNSRQRSNRNQKQNTTQRNRFRGSVCRGKSEENKRIHLIRGVARRLTALARL